MLFTEHYFKEEFINTPNFKKWFGKSKIVDYTGNPQMVYHGTSSKFRKFNIKKTTQGIIWFTSDKTSIEKGEVGAQGSGVILPLYIKIENPAGWEEYDKFMLDELISRGYDGVILPENGGSFSGFVFNPNQLKSATKNNGDFSTRDNNIYK